MALLKWMSSFGKGPLLCVLVGLAVAGLSSPAWTQSQMRPGITDGDFDPTAPPPEMRGVSIEQTLGAAVPLDSGLLDELGNRITLGELLADGRPVLLDLGYYECPLLCPTVKRGITRALQESIYTLNADFRIVSISIDPEESPGVARKEKARVLGGDDFPELPTEQAEAGWRFLTGPEPAVRAIADAVGYGYKYLPQQDEYGHAAAIIFLSPEGTVSSYLFGVDYPGRQFDLAIGDATAGALGSIWRVALQFCYAFDPNAGAYVVVAKNVMMLGGAVTLVAVVGCVGGLFWWERRRRLRRGGGIDSDAGPGSSSGSSSGVAPA